jgi:hypothetical protein
MTPTSRVEVAWKAQVGGCEQSSRLLQSAPGSQWAQVKILPDAADGAIPVIDHLSSARIAMQAA